MMFMNWGSKEHYQLFRFFIYEQLLDRLFLLDDNDVISVALDDNDLMFMSFQLR